MFRSIAICCGPISSSPSARIEPHLLLGFAGGSKMILPGLASSRTIAENHMQGGQPRAIQLRSECPKARCGSTSRKA
jgi:nickel-dependent lactate racemase